MASQRWQPICQDCWQAARPTEYWPGDTGFDTCASCGNDALILNAHPETVREAKAALNPFAVEFITYADSDFVRNGMSFATVEDAKAYAIDLRARWTALDGYRVVDTRTGEVVAS